MVRLARTSLFIVVAAAALTSACGRKHVTQGELAPTKMTSIGVNTYLWRAAIDTLSFAPLVTADSNGGVIITDWYASPTNPGERVKITASVLDQDLRADALRVAAVRQVNQGGTWVEAPVSALSSVASPVGAMATA